MPVDIKEVILIHELGHLFFPKELNDMQLAPSKNQYGLNKKIMKCLNSEIFIIINLNSLITLYCFCLTNLIKN